MRALCALALCTLGLSLFAVAQEPTFVTIDPPGSTDTQVNSINSAGVITGYYFEGNVSHGSCALRTASTGATRVIALNYFAMLAVA
jgi:hypothetical protein